MKGLITQFGVKLGSSQSMSHDRGSILLILSITDREVLSWVSIIETLRPDDNSSRRKIRLCGNDSYCYGTI